MKAETNASAGLSRVAALRIGLAAGALPEVKPRRLLYVLADALGMPLSEDKLQRVTVRALQTALNGELAEVDEVYLQQAVRCLRGEQTAAVEAGEPPRPQPYRDGELPGSIRVAFASNSGERLDGHFGSCTRFLIYQVARDTARLIDVRSVAEPAGVIKDELHAYRVGLIKDCHILYVVSIGGPPAAKVVRAGIHPLKHPQPAEIRELLPALQRVLAGRPPPWLARLTGAGAQEPLNAEVE